MGTTTLIKLLGIELPENADAGMILRHQELVSRGHEWLNHNNHDCRCPSCTWAVIAIGNRAKTLAGGE